MAALGQLPVFVQYAHEEGNPSAINAVGDYSVTPKTFLVRPEGETNQHWQIDRIGVFMRFIGPPVNDGYANGPALTNGIQARIYRGGEIKVEILGGVPTKRTSGWLQIMGEPFRDVAPGNFTVNSLAFRWFFTGAPLILDGTYDDEFRIEYHDDFSGLLEHTVVFFGVNL
jgi:hypothetical protein